MTTTTLTTAAAPGDWWKQGWNKIASFVRCEPTMVTTIDEPPVSSFEATQVIPAPGDDEAVMVRCNDCHHLVPEANVAIHQANCARRPSLEQASTQQQQTMASPEQDSAQRQQDNNTQRRMPFLSNFPGFRKREDNPKQEEGRDNWEMVERDDTQGQRDVNEWACPRCTLLNPSSSTRCGACRYTQQRESDSVRQGRPAQPSNQQRQNTPPPPGSWMGGGAVVGGILGALIGALAGNPVGGAVNGAMNGAMSGAIAESASRAQAMQQQQLQQARARQRGGLRQAHQTRPRTNAGMMQTRIHYPDGTVRIVSGGDPFMARAMARSLNAAHNNNNNGVDGMSYDQLLQTFGDGSENSNRGADERVLASLPTSRVKETTTTTNSTKASEQCPICLENFKKGDSRKTLPCLHGFHAGCVDKWLRTNASCPMCKHPIE